jgi:hypothetical protein
MSTYPAHVCLRRRDDGGKLSGPPSGPVYAATAVAVLGGDADVLPGWPATAPQFSIVLEFDAAPIEGDWSPTRVRALVEGAPGSEALEPGAELLVMEGPRDVARLVLDQEVGATT